MQYIFMSSAQFCIFFLLFFQKEMGLYFANFAFSFFLSLDLIRLLSSFSVISPAPDKCLRRPLSKAQDGSWHMAPVFGFVVVFFYARLSRMPHYPLLHVLCSVVAFTTWPCNTISKSASTFIEGSLHLCHYDSRAFILQFKNSFYSTSVEGLSEAVTNLS